MTTIKSFTDLSQSKTLSKILPLESADMVYFGIHQGIDGKYHISGTNTEDDIVPIYKNLCTKVFTETTTSDIICMLPCWSLAALLSVIPKPDLVQNSEGTWLLRSWVNAYPWSVGGYSNSIDACVAMIEKLHELKML